MNMFYLEKYLAQLPPARGIKIFQLMFGSLPSPPQSLRMGGNMVPWKKSKPLLSPSGHCGHTWDVHCLSSPIHSDGHTTLLCQESFKSASKTVVYAPCQHTLPQLPIRRPCLKEKGDRFQLLIKLSPRLTYRPNLWKLIPLLPVLYPLPSATRPFPSPSDSPLHLYSQN